MHVELLDYTQRLLATQSEQKAAEMLLEFCVDHGADGGNIWFATGVDEEHCESASATSYPPEFSDIIYDAEALKDWNSAKRIANSLQPLRWGWEICKETFPVKSQDYRISEIAYDFGINNLLAIPIPTAGFNGSSGFSFYLRSDAKSFDKLVTAAGSLLKFAGTLTHVHLQMLRRRNKQVGVLTTREKECLLLLSQGFRSKQIGHALGIREVTVHLHLTNARNRLSAKTREQALATAILTGQISR